MIDDLIAALNAYTGDNIWQDIILRHPAYSEALTDLLDQDGAQFASADDKYAGEVGDVIGWAPGAWPNNSEHGGTWAVTGWVDHDSGFHSRYRAR